MLKDAAPSAMTPAHARTKLAARDWADPFRINAADGRRADDTRNGQHLCPGQTDQQGR